MRSGIPPSPDRIILIRQIRAIVLLVVLVCGIALFFSKSFLSGPDSFTPAPSQRGSPSGNNKAQVELASAFQAVQRAVVVHIGPENLEEMEWLEPQHEGHRGWYSYDGQVRVKDGQEFDGILNYAVVLELDSNDEWQVLSIDVRR